MILLLDAHIAPSLAVWIENEFKIKSYSFDYLNWRTLADKDCFLKAKEMNGVIVTKDNDFITLLEKLKSPPKIIWLTCGNTSKESLKKIFTKQLNTVLALLNENDLVELTG